MNKKNVLIGVCGGVATYKICGLVRYFIKRGFNIKVIMTKSGTEFVTPLTFQTLSGNRVYTDMFDQDRNDVEHISLAKWADVVLIAPATANTISKIAHGIGDNLLTTVIMAIPNNKKIIIAPAMNSNMWSNSLIQQNIKSLKLLNRYIFVDPQVGRLACGDDGVGKMADTEKISKIIEENV